jgi:Fe-S-cluster-containing dehydrogenase component/CRP-like cAMP-binding protein
MQRPSRWDSPFSPDMTDADVGRLLSIPPLNAIDASLFPASLALTGIIRNDARIERCRRGDIVVREGDYGNSTFVVLEGAVGVVVAYDADMPFAAPQSRPRRNVMSSLAQIWRNALVPEARDVQRYLDRSAVSLRYENDTEARPVVKDLDALIAQAEIVTIGEGETFGEIAALSRTPRTATCVALTDCDLLELRWQGLRDIRRYDPGFRQRIDELYRTRSLQSHLAESPLFDHLDAAALSQIIAETQFETYGEFEWFSAFKRQIEESDESLVIEREPTIVNEGDYADGLILIRSGFARVSEKLGFGRRTVRCEMKNDVFGLEEVYEHWRNGGPLAYRHSLTAIGYVDILRVPTALVEQHVLPNLSPERYEDLTDKRDFSAALDHAVINFLVDRRIVNGTAVMMINTERCVGCDDCVRACAATHDNNPRFVRHGAEHDKLMIANACMHCQDPVCLIGCPTGAIHRRAEDGRVIINDTTCIGCGTCANSCPYNNIRLVEIRKPDGAFIVDEATNAPIMKATKCDLCMDQLGGPACQRACPHDALVRMDMRDQATLARWINR